MAASKAIKIVTIGAGHIEPVDNCSYDALTQQILFTDPNKNARISIVPDSEDAKDFIIKMGMYTLSSSPDYLLLEANSNYEDILIDFGSSSIEAWIDSVLSE